MHVTNRSALMSELIVGLSSFVRSPLGLLNAMRASTVNRIGTDPLPTHHRSRGGWGMGKKRYYHTNPDGKRVQVPAGSDRPACKFLPNVAGMRYQDGYLIPRATGTTTRKRKKVTKPAATLAKPKRRKSGGYMRNDFKGIARAARRAGVISPRQQRKLHKLNRQFAKAGWGEAEEAVPA